MEGQSPTIAVVGGTGVEGSAIALRLGHVGYGVIIGTRDSAKGVRVTAELNKLLGAEVIAFSGNAEAASAADIVILTVPYAAQRSIVLEIAATLEGKILINATAPLVPPKVSNVQLPPGGSAVAQIQHSLGDKVRVISAFQNVAAHKLRLLDADVECDVLVCGDDVQAGVWHASSFGGWVACYRGRPDLQLGGGGGADLAAHILQSQIQGLRLRYPRHRFGRKRERLMSLALRTDSKSPR
jgi:8-hydroxy-5-deazaflavin:NADPH oxidoreductase